MQHQQTTFDPATTDRQRILPAIASATLTIYQFFDIGDAIDLDHAQRCLNNPSERRVRLRTRQSESIRIAQPPLRIELGSLTVSLADTAFEGVLRAVVYDLGAVEMAVEMRPAVPLSWEDAATLFAAAQELPPALSADASRLVTAISYYLDDLALLSWNGALLIEPDAAAAATAAEIIAFANVELLLIRSYDAALDARLPEVHRRIAQAQRRFTLPLVRRYSQLLSDVQRLVAEVTEVTEQIDNALKVTDDVYWNRLYSAALGVLRVRVWRDGVDHKLALLRETYAMLHADADSERAAALEWAIVLLIVFEIVMALLERSGVI